MLCRLLRIQKLKRLLLLLLSLSLLPLKIKKSPHPGSRNQSLRGDGSALESRSLSLAFPVGNLKLGLRELNSS